MANTDAPFGCLPLGSNGAPYNGQTELMYMPSSDATVLAVGDLVKLVAGGDSDGVPQCDIVAAGDTPCGIVVGFDWRDGARDDLPNYKPASTEAYIIVATDPNLEFIIQDDASATLAATDIGSNADIATYVAANSTTGRSQIELDASTAANTSTLVLNIKRLHQTPDNEIGNNAIWVCGFNVHQYGSVGTTSV